MKQSAAPTLPQHHATPLAIWSALAAVYLIWGSTYLAIRYAVETAPPFLMAGARFLVAGAFLYAARRFRGDPKPTTEEWRSAALIGIFLLVGGNGGVVWAEQFVASSLAALLVATVPLWMVLIDAVRPGGQRPGVIAIAGILIGFGGAVLLVGWARNDGPGINLLGAAVLLFASLIWATGSVYGKTARLPVSSILATGMEKLAGGTVLMLLALACGEWTRFDIATVSHRSLFALIYLIVFGSGAFVAYAWLLRVAPIPLVSTYAYVNPLVAVLLGYFLAGEPVTLRIMFAAVLIIGSVALVSVPRHR